MEYTIFNDCLSVRIDSRGAQLRSVLSANGTEYLWQGDPKYWADSSPILFPYIARLYGGYTYMGEPYNMGIHGFAAQCQFSVQSHTSECLTLVLCENSETLAQYPFRFSLSISYSLSASSLQVSCKVMNKDAKPMPFALGGHPGFNVPLYEGTVFEDYFLSFDKPCTPLRVGFSDELFLSGKDLPYPLEDGRIINLHHSLFDDDALILRNTSHRVTLGCRKAKGSLSIDFSDFDFFGIWHMPKTDAPYVCLEPWTSLPSRQGIVEELSEKPDMIILKSGEEQLKTWTLTITEG